MLVPSTGFTAPLKSSLSLLALLAGLAPICRSAVVAPQATPVDSLHVADGFKVELLYSVPKDRQESWVAMTVDPKDRLIVSDQYGGLYRVTPSE